MISKLKKMTRLNPIFALLVLTLSGCNNSKNTMPRNGDYRLNDIWALESISGKPIPGSARTPYLEFHLTDNRMMGFGGCNEMSGPIDLTKRTVTFGNIISTEMACPALETETAFLQMLNNRKLRYAFGENKLILSGDNGDLVFKKVD